jgi:beta-phosphoglucomutase-like phosphatase (HAD superfamily)
MRSSSPAFAVVRGAVDAELFDLAGVVTQTAKRPAAACKELFDGHLQQRATQQLHSVQPLDPDFAYRRYLEGRPRDQGPHVS